MSGGVGGVGGVTSNPAGSGDVTARSRGVLILVWRHLGPLPGIMEKTKKKTSAFIIPKKGKR